MRRAWRVTLVCALVSGAVAGVPPACAEEPTAEATAADATAAQFFRAGRAAFERHEYRAAALAFEEAFRQSPRGAMC